MAVAQKRCGHFFRRILIEFEYLERKVIMRKIEPERIERVARIYASNQEASCALGIAPGSFSRLCRLYNIETPYARKRRRREEFFRRREIDLLYETEIELEALDPEIDIQEIAELEEAFDLNCNW